MEIRIKDAGEFHTLLNALIGELTQAQDHFGLVTDLNAAARAEYAQVFDQSRTFWYLTYRAQREATWPQSPGTRSQLFSPSLSRSLLPYVFE